MSLFSKIKKILETENACTISQDGNPLYVVLKWEKYQQITQEEKDLKSLKERVEAEEKEEEGIDINSIPV
ncbi:MAG: hypothetical protein UV58_C0017G0014 [Candidatus Wolfebacteria bacterium GW2011_GWC1_43_10]|uniref:Prevent-host-death protein n=2 Tax=Candidatus Wolfeibacteriota TaxID=1752735 RepID=A0A0G1C8J0_9BACT|nr:MAG: hypothetical protein UV58_C0017G0014 [Candidatus Wolfebacteria bacterium GW2011_GWC1_43_10]KKT22952.1 MAG: hypothetical protein UW08_C0002G0081 [Parcubacteria group bacterium GW2011_GWB1_43_8b]OGM89908.1 MAG: hypothetical protein A2108_02915 [Candidatus Wolfebacteria bacterium GWA1_42_9]